MPLKNKNDSPPGGWKFTQPETGWSSDPWRGFAETVREIMAHRRANPRFNLVTDFDTVAVELENFTCERLRSIPGGDQWLAPGDSPVFTRPPARVRPVGGVAAVVEKAGQIYAGIKLWLEWFGSSGPVDKALSEKRASVCVACPLNQAGSVVTETAAEELTRLLGSLHQKDCQTSLDEKLHTCSACLCPLKAKVWSPLSIILKHQKAATKKKLDKSCWILSEQA